MKSYPLGFIPFSNLSITASNALTSSYALPTVSTASFTLLPTGSKGSTQGTIYLLSSSLGVCVSPTPTPTPTLTPTPTPTLTPTLTPTPTASEPSITCGQACGSGFPSCPDGCTCSNGGDPFTIGICNPNELF